MPAEFHANRATCSKTCAASREWRQSGGKRASARRATAVDDSPGPVTRSAQPNLCDLLEGLAGQVGPGWQAQVALSGVTLTWRPAE
jgi:hypothetical protein